MCIPDVGEHEDLGSSMGGKVGGNRRLCFEINKKMKLVKESLSQNMTSLVRC